MKIKNLLLTLKNSTILFEFIKYVFIGGIAFVLDFGTLYIAKEYILPDANEMSLYIAVTLGFIVGFISNYILSFLFVFTSEDDRSRATSVATIITFLFVGLIGLLLNWAGMYIGVELLNLHYLFVKIGVAGIVLIWNYFGRKIFLSAIKNN